MSPTKMTGFFSLLDGGPRFDGPFEIVRVHINGNASTIRISPSVTERLNIRRLKPYREQ